MVRNLLGLLVTFAMVPTLAACGHGLPFSSTPDAASGLRAYAAALRADDPRRAFDMLSKQTQSEMTFDQFALIWRQHKPERMKQAEEIETELADSSTLKERALVRVSGDASVTMARENGAWRLETSLLSRVRTPAPEDAVRVLAEALAGRDYFAVMRTLTNRRRAALEARFDDLSTSLIEHLGDDVNVIGPNRAELTWETEATRYKLVLRKEGFEWRVDDFHIRSKQ